MVSATVLWSYSCRPRTIMAEDKTKIATLAGTSMLTVVRFCDRPRREQRLDPQPEIYTAQGSSCPTPHKKSTYLGT